MENTGGAMEIGASFAIPAVSRNPKAALSTIPGNIYFHHTGKRI